MVVKNENPLSRLLSKYPHKSWNWYGLSQNPDITPDIIEKNLDNRWNWTELSQNPNITIDIIEKYHYKPLNWEWISRNPNLTIEFIEKHIDKIDFYTLSDNLFTFQKKLDRIRKRVHGLWILNKSSYFLGDSLKRGIIQGYL